MTVPFYSNRSAFQRRRNELARRIDEVVSSGVFFGGTKQAELEDRICQFTGAKHAIGSSSATSALTTILRAAGVGPGDEVIVPCYSFFASASSISLVGATPVFADVEPASYALRPDAIIENISPRTKAIVPVHLFNQMADMITIKQIAADYDLLLLEDSAEAIGMSCDGQHGGTIGEAGVLSFFPTKTLGSYGDAGMILTNDDQLANRFRIIQHQGRQSDSSVVMPGGNTRFDEFHAAILLTRLDDLETELARREELFEEYSRQLAPYVQTPHIVERQYPTRAAHYVYLVEAERRDDLVAHLSGDDISTETYYPVPFHRQPCFRHLPSSQRSFPIAENAASRAVALPFYPELTVDGFNRVCRSIERFYMRRAIK